MLRSRNTERIFLLGVIVIMVVLFNSLFAVLERGFDDVPQRLANGTMVNLNDENAAQRFKTVLQRGFYFEDPRDVELITSVVSQQIGTGETVIDNIGELNKSKYNVNAEQAFLSGGESFKKRVEVSRAQLGFSDDDSVLFAQEKKAPVSLPSENHLSLGSHKISGIIKNRDQHPVTGVLV